MHLAKSCQSAHAYRCSSLEFLPCSPGETVALSSCIKPESSDPTVRPDVEDVQRPWSASAPCMFTEFCFPRAGPPLDSLFTFRHIVL